MDPNAIITRFITHPRHAPITRLHDTDPSPIRRDHLVDHRLRPLQAHHLRQDPGLLRHVVPTTVLDGLQRGGSPGLGRQGHNHHTRPHIQSGDMVAVLLQPRHQHHVGVGVREETVAHAGGIQHHVDMAQPHGAGTEPDTIIYCMTVMSI